MAHTKAQGSSSNGRDSAGQRLGIKAYGSELVNAGSIIVRQRGTKYMPGKNVGMGKDNTLYAKITGVIKFERKSGNKPYVNVFPVEAKA
jgi:large subunit ribosomal protein L27